MARSFTGWHMTAIMVTFFGMVVAVNIEMATLAGRTFGGTVVENSYVASQQFNDWLAAARRQKAQRWSLTPAIGPGRDIILAVSVHGHALDDARIEAVLRHPLGRLPERHIAFKPDAAGRYRSEGALPKGRWLIHFTVQAPAGKAQFDDEIPA